MKASYKRLFPSTLNGSGALSGTPSPGAARSWMYSPVISRSRKRAEANSRSAACSWSLRAETSLATLLYSARIDASFAIRFPRDFFSALSLCTRPLAIAKSFVNVATDVPNSARS